MLADFARRRAEASSLLNVRASYLESAKQLAGLADNAERLAKMQADFQLLGPRRGSRRPNSD